MWGVRYDVGVWGSGLSREVLNVADVRRGGSPAEGEIVDVGKDGHEYLAVEAIHQPSVARDHIRKVLQHAHHTNTHRYIHTIHTYSIHMQTHNNIIHT